MKTRILSLLLLATIFAACNPGGDHATTETSGDDRQVQIVEITVGPLGYNPRQVNLKAGIPARLVFTRTTESHCLEQVKIPAFGIETTDLPLNKSVSLSFTPDESGTFNFMCGMDMQEGTIVVKS